MDRAGQRIVVVAPCVSEAPARALTAVENRIARRAGQAMTNRVIAAEMKLSQTAVENHLSRALRKLGLRDRVALARLYTQLEADGRV
jgi:DNA-binding NarL/FixJ family response regulator